MSYMQKTLESLQKNLLELINSAKLQGAKSTCKNHFFYTLGRKILKKIKKTIPSAISSKRTKSLRNDFN